MEGNPGDGPAIFLPMPIFWPWPLLSVAEMGLTGRSSMSIDRKMFGQQQDIANAVGHARLMDLYLETAGVLVVGQPEIKKMRNHLAGGGL